MANRQTIKKIKLGNITADPDLQPRTGINLEMVEGYADAMRRGDRFPPLTVFYDGKAYLLSDGFHRLRAARAIKAKTVLCEVRKGGRREALLHSVSCNSTHGLPRSNEDKRQAVGKLLKDKQWCEWSDREIAKRCRVGHPLVAQLRNELAVTGSSSSERTYRTKHGKVAKMKTKNIGSKPKPAKPIMPPPNKRDFEIEQALFELNEQVEKYPQAAQAVAACDRGAFNNRFLTNIVKWLSDFAKAWEQRPRVPKKRILITRPF